MTLMMKTTTKSVLSIDIETYCDLDLTKTGVYKYVDHPSFEVLLLTYSVDEGPEFLVDFTAGDTLPEEIVEALTDPTIIKAAYNANFERTALKKHCGKEMPPEQWRCTMVRAATLGLPGTLAAVGEVLGLPEDQAKKKSGKALITYFSKPCRPTARNHQRTRNLPHHDPEKWELYKEYNITDVVAEKEIYKRLAKFPATIKEEQDLWSLDQRINDTGVLIDQELVNNILVYNETHQEELIERAQEITGVDNPKSVQQSKEWLETKGITTESLNKAAVKELLADTENKKVKEFLKIKQQLGKTSVSKYEAMERAVCEDGKIRGMLQFYGANRTGRWCLAEGSRVLIRDKDKLIYEKPIEQVLLTDEVWDGLYWVNHEGVVFSGIKTVIEHDGVIATSDHEVWVSPDKKLTLGEAKDKGLKLWAGGIIQP